MNPKEKAKELIDYKFASRKLFAFTNPQMDNKRQNWSFNQRKQMALICTEEIINQWEYIDIYLGNGNGELNPNLEYWYQVKQEIERL